MRANIFLIIFFCLAFSLSLNTESRELSIQQLEERKKADRERKKQERSEVKKFFPKRNYNYNQDSFYLQGKGSAPCTFKS